MKQVFYLFKQNGKLISIRELKPGFGYVNDFAVSEDGTMVAFSLSRSNACDIYLTYINFPDNDGKVHNLPGKKPARKEKCFDKLIQISFDKNFKRGLYFNDDNLLYFTAAREEENEQVYVYTGKEIRQVTQDPIGAWYPRQRNNKLYYFTIGKGGFIITSQIMKNEHFTKVNKPLETYSKKDKPILRPEFQNFLSSPFTGTVPYFWYPLITFSAGVFNSNSFSENSINVILRFLGKNIFDTIWYDINIDYQVLAENITGDISLDLLFDAFYFSQYFRVGVPIRNTNENEIFSQSTLSFPFYLSILGSGRMGLSFALYNEPSWQWRKIEIIFLHQTLRYVRLHTFPRSGYKNYFAVGHFSPFLGSMINLNFLQNDFYLYQALGSWLTLRFRLTGGLVWGPDTRPYFNIKSFGDLEKPFRDLDLTFKNNSYYSRLGQLTPTTRFGTFSIDFLIPLWNYFGFSRIFPWLQFQNMTFILFYEMLVKNFNFKETPDHGGGLALDFRFSSFPKMIISQPRLSA